MPYVHLLWIEIFGFHNLAHWRFSVRNVTYFLSIYILGNQTDLYITLLTFEMLFLFDLYLALYVIGSVFYLRSMSLQCISYLNPMFILWVNITSSP